VDEKAHALLTHAGTHANGHTDAEEAQRAAFPHAAASMDAANTNGANTATIAAAEHIFTAHGVHAGTTLGAARVAHAGAFVEEGNHNETGNGDEEPKKEGKASRFVAKLKGKMHVR
jgi:hypothetical protein